MKSAKRKRIVLSTAVLVIATVIIAGALLGYARMINKRLIEEINQRGKQISEQNEFAVEEEIKGQMNSLMEISERISAFGAINIDKDVAALKSIGKRYSFKRVAIITPDGEAYTTDKVKMNLSEREFFQKSMQGENFISGRLSDYTDGEDIIVFSVPIYIDDRVEGVLIATYSANTMQDMLAFLSGEDCDSYVVDAEGKLIVSSIQDDKIDYENEDIYSILSMLERTKKMQNRCRKILRRKKPEVSL